MTMHQVCLLLLLFAALLGSSRYLVSVWRSEKSRRPKMWRVCALLLLQIACAALLYLTLFPPPTSTRAERLVILTANAEQANTKISGRVLALPEATAAANIERVPDLASALRRYPGVNSLQIVGAGLGARDREAAKGLSLAFLPAPLPQGLIELSLPEIVSPGARWSVHGKVHQVEQARIELLDPGNNRVATTEADAEGNFSLSDTARSVGIAMYQLRILDGNKKTLETVSLPLNIVSGQPMKILSLSGGPNPELKYLRRWAMDAGIDLQSQVNLSVGVQMNNAAISLAPASLRETDLLMLDERAWNALGQGSRQAVIDALRNGMGVLLRITGPLAASDRASLRTLGFSVSDANLVQGIHLGKAQDGKNSPTLTRRPLRVESADGVVLLHDEANNPLALWRAEGRGRMALWWLTDSYKLQLDANDSRHGQLWRDAISTLARSRAENRIHPDNSDARINERLVFCDIATKSLVQQPDANLAYLLPEKNCAAFWPRHDGWHRLVSGTQELPFYVRRDDEAPGLKANSLRENTLLLAATHSTAKNTGRIPVPGSPWPWFFSWLLVAALLWWLERSSRSASSG